eukprot:scpid38265/ scgid32035/ Protein kintoun; Dynein assembly factor 2, axonemal
MAQASKERFEMTSEEVDKIGKALKNEDFRKMLFEYAEEISDPANKARYEKEIAELEKERGSDVTFLHPKPGFVVKTYTDAEKTKKVFLNVCHAPEIEMATSTRVTNADGVGGQNWSIPYSIAAAREDIDKAKKRCIVIDIIFNERTLELAKKDKRFQKLVIDTCFEGLEQKQNAKLLTTGYHILKHVEYKGQPQSSVLRKPGAKPSDMPEPADDFSKKLESMYPYKDADEKQPSSASSLLSNGRTAPATTAPPKGKEAVAPPASSRPSRPSELQTANLSQPQYRIVQRGYFDIQDFRMARDAGPGCWPKQLVVTISLPKCANMTGVELEVLSKEVLLTIESLDVDLEIALPYAVNEESGSATFDKSKRELVVTLNVLPPPASHAAASFNQTTTSAEQDEDEGKEAEEDTDAEKLEHTDTDVTAANGSGSFSSADMQAMQKSQPVEECDVAEESTPAEGLQSGVGDDGRDESTSNGSTAPGTGYACSESLPELELSQSKSEISMFWHVDSPTNLHVQETTEKAILDWDVVATQTHYRVVIASCKADELFHVITTNSISAGILVLLAKEEQSQVLWTSIAVGPASNKLQLVDFKQPVPGAEEVPTDGVINVASAHSDQQENGTSSNSNEEQGHDTNATTHSGIWVDGEQPEADPSMNDNGSSAPEHLRSEVVDSQLPDGSLPISAIVESVPRSRTEIEQGTESQSSGTVQTARDQADDSEMQSLHCSDSVRMPSDSKPDSTAFPDSPAVPTASSDNGLPATLELGNPLIFDLDD